MSQKSAIVVILLVLRSFLTSHISFDICSNAWWFTTHSWLNNSFLNVCCCRWCIELRFCVLPPNDQSSWTFIWRPYLFLLTMIFSSCLLKMKKFIYLCTLKSTHACNYIQLIAPRLLVSTQKMVLTSSTIFCTCVWIFYHT